MNDTQEPVVRIRILRRAAVIYKGIDLSNAESGWVVDVPENVATFLLRAGWAEWIRPDR